MNRFALLAAALLALAQTACGTLSEREHARVVEVVDAARGSDSTCDRADACARPSPPCIANWRCRSSRWR